MAVNLSFIGGAGWQFLDNNGNPLSGGKIYTYAAGTTTPLTTYTSRSGVVANTNPIILDAAGRTPEQIWSTEGLLYKYVVADANNVIIRTWDNIGGSIVASDLAQDLANTTDNAKGDALIGFKQSNTAGFLPNAVARTVNDKLQETVSVKDFGAVGDGVADDTQAIQRAIDVAQDNGAELYFPAGFYRVTSKLYLDLRNEGGAPNTNRRRVNWRGDGKGNTVLKTYTDSSTILHIQGPRPLTSGSHGYFEMRGLAFAGQSPTPRTSNGLFLQDLAYLTISECSFHNLNVCMLLEGCLSSSFENLIFNESTKGVVAQVGSTGPHSNLWTGCEFRFLTSLGYDGYTSLSGATFVNCRFEACGTASDLNTGALRQTTSSTAGEHGMTFIGCYIENNRGGFDIQFNASSASRRTALNIIGCCFNRLSSTSFVVNNIVTTGPVNLDLMGNTFTSYNTYVPDASRPYLNVSSTTLIRDLGNRWEDEVETSVIGQSVPYAGFVQGSLGAAVTGTLPNSWSVSQVSTGIFRVIHNMNNLNYAVVATTTTGDPRTVERVVREASSFQVKITNELGVPTNANFSFMLSVLKANR